jgi:hypothetical protein
MAVGFYIFLAFVFSGIVYIIYDVNERNKEGEIRWRIRKAQKRFYKGNCITSDKGEFFVRVSKHQWVEVIWDKPNGILKILTPPDEYERREKYPILRIQPNWYIEAECQPKQVTVEEYFVRQVM